MLNLILMFERVKNKIIRSYRKYVFRKSVGCNHDDFKLVGKVSLINCNIKMGKNVCIYPDVMFYGDGLIEIGNNVVIGNGTIIYSSSVGG